MIKQFPDELLRCSFMKNMKNTTYHPIGLLYFNENYRVEVIKSLNL